MYATITVATSPRAIDVCRHRESQGDQPRLMLLLLAVPCSVVRTHLEILYAKVLPGVLCLLTEMVALLCQSLRLFVQFSSGVNVGERLVDILQYSVVEHD